MKGLATLIKLHKRKVDERRRKLAELERLRENLVANLVTLDSEMAAEREAASRVAELAHAFPAFAAAAIARRDTLKRSLVEADAALAVARDELAEAFQEVKRYELAEEMRERREREKAGRRLQATLDEIGLNQHRRKVQEAG